MKKICQAFRSYKNISNERVFSLKRLTQSCQSAYKLATIGLLLTVAGISGCTSSTNAQSSSSLDKWSGEWQLKDPAGSGGSIKIILTKDGKAYVIPPVPNSSEPVAYDMPLERVSDNTNLPANMKVVKLEDTVKKQANKARQSEGKTYTGAMNRAQQAYLLENNKFATTIKELQLGIKSETENYVYKIVPQSSKAQGVMSIAQARREGLNSYVGLVYLVKTNSGESTTISKLCETSQSVSKTPEIPSITKNAAKAADIECPSGFKSLR